jgi:hypothetical protein
MVKEKKIRGGTQDPQRLLYLETWEAYAREGCYDQGSDDDFHECRHSHRTPEEWKEIQGDSKRWLEIPFEATSFCDNGEILDRYRQEFLTKWMPCVLVEEWFSGRQLRFRFVIKDGE